MTTPPAVAGRMASRYRIVEQIGAGAMGIVYRAIDERLERDVALKILSPGLLADPAARRRFRTEALALSHVNHPNIATIFDFDSDAGLDFLVMEYVDGEPLSARVSSGGLQPEQVVSIGEQIALALDEACERGVTHRDLKPANIVVTRKRRVKVLDFGLATLLRSTTANDQTRSIADSTPLAGTLPYMSPEQLRGEKADGRSDIYACGVVLYELATGRRPFDNEVPARLCDQILHEPVLAPRALNTRLSAELERIILKCLERQPEDRYQSAKELAIDLRRSLHPSVPSATRTRTPRKRVRLAALAFLGAAVAVAAVVLIVRGTQDGRVQPANSIAVLPLENLSKDAGQDYLADSMTEALITNLAKIDALRVISRTTMMRFKNTTKSVPEIANELHVDAVVEGSIERVGERVRITAQLIRGATDRHVWADSYDRDLGDVLQLQSEVAQEIARQIQVSLSPEDRERLANQRRVNPQAYQLYVKGRSLLIRRTPESVNQALQLFTESAAIDPNYAEAYSGLADAYASLGFSFDVGTTAPNAVQPKARSAAMRALALNDRLADAHNSLAYFMLNYDWDWAGAEQEFHRSLQLNPGYANAHHWYAHLLLSAGRQNEALAESQKALQLDQLSPIMNVHLAWHYYLTRQYGDALNQLSTTLQLEPDYGLAFWYRGLVYEETGKTEQAIAEMLHASDLLKGNLNVRADLAHAYAVAGHHADAQRILAELAAASRKTYVNPYEVAVIFLGLGQTADAFADLQRALQDRSDLLIYLKLDPRMTHIRSDARFKALVEKVGIP